MVRDGANRRLLTVRIIARGYGVSPGPARKPNPPRYTSGVLAKFARLVQGAERGAVTNVSL